jgi:hypothetical protein
LNASSVLERPLADRGGLGSRSWRAGVGAGRRARVLAGLLSVVMVAAILEIVIDGAVGSSPLIPLSPDITGWFNKLGEPLGYRIFLMDLLGFTGAYAGLVLLRRQLDTRLILILIVVVQVIVTVGPVLLSTDVFSYLAYARMGALHGVNPYTHGPLTILEDPIYEFVGADWKRSSTAYGPLYTLTSYPIALLGVNGSVWAMKAVALISSFGTLALTWYCAERRGLDRKLALVIVGLNPLWVIYGLGGAHNDLLMILFMMGAVALVLVGREAAAAVSIVAGTLIKATVGIMIPFLILGSDLRRLPPAGEPAQAGGRESAVGRSRRGAIILATVGSLVVGLGVGYALFGKQGIDLIAGADRDSLFVSRDSFPLVVAHLAGKPGVFPIDHDILKGMLVFVIVYLLWRTWRGFDWVAASGWAMLAIAVTSTWLLAWYTLWSLPLAVVTRDRRLLAATLVIQGLFIVHQLPPLFSQQS